MAHFFVSPSNFKGRRFIFDPAESRHLARVLRKKAGDMIQVFNGEGIVQAAVLLDVSDPERVEGELTDQALPFGRSRLTSKKIASVSVIPAVLKGPRFDWLIEKLTELSVHEISPILTERTVVRMKPQDFSGKTRRWEKIALAAASQCGRKSSAKVRPPRTFEEALASLPKNDLNLILWESEEKKSISEAIGDRLQIQRSGIRVNLLVGPEGGFTVREADLAQSKGAVPVHLGEHILRAETAAIAAASFILLL
ncbi:MAG: hypothetical protein A3A86_04060 [Elusimicrobia bacterium RIFCSPLOWO2_01_FULL_60_11]|nr:MAG: hypothetical protein A3A86_04060 [Elusimicrobia bacterium RIFCSPLOWO2_01_FULL_60_11]